MKKIFLLTTILLPSILFAVKPNIRATSDSASELKAYYGFEENTGEYSYDNWGGSLVGSTSDTVRWTGISWVTGKYGYCPSFDGSTSSGSANVQPDLEFGSDGTWSISFWFEVDQWAGDGVIAGRWDTGAAARVFLVSLDGTQKKIAVQTSDRGSSGELDYLDNKTFFSEQWYHICIAAGEAHIDWYVDGILIETDANAMTKLSDLAPENIGLHIGANFNGTGNFFNGKIDELYFYDRELSRGEAAILAE
jgi:hypothetical protein